MRKILPVPGGGQHLGELPIGCQLCLKGAKLVVFVTGICPLDCFYCPISHERRQQDVMYANERPVTSIDEILNEGELCSAEGASLTGGEPLSVFPRTILVIQRLKAYFGPEFHVHLYTGVYDLSSEQITALEKAGLDELRLHQIGSFSVPRLNHLLQSKMAIGGEIPVIPGRFSQIIWVIQHLDHASDSTNAKSKIFLNLNELEASETNIDQLRQRGFTVPLDAIAEIKGSKEVAEQVVEWSREHSHIDVHYCPSRSKDTIQLRNRFLRRARNIRRPYEEITSEGLLTKGAVLLPKGIDASEVITPLLDRLQLAPSMIYNNQERRQVEFSRDLAKQVIKTLDNRLQVGILEEYPTWNRLQISFTPV